MSYQTALTKHKFTYKIIRIFSGKNKALSQLWCPLSSAFSTATYIASPGNKALPFHLVPGILCVNPNLTEVMLSHFHD